MTADSHFHIKNKRLTNVSPPVDDHDVTTKKFVADLLKTKAGTTCVNNELAKKPNKKYVNSVVSSSLQDYYTKAEIDDNYVLRTDLPSDNALAHYANLADYYTKTQVDNIVQNAVASTKLKYQFKQNKMDQ